MGCIAVLVDRDGTLVKDVPYLNRVEDLQLLPTVGSGLKLLNDNQIKVIVITNQSGIARGYFDEHTLEKIHEKMRSDLAKVRANIDAIYYCPHHPDEQCKCRKPNTGLLELAAREWQFDITKSYFIGDKLSDIQAANRMGCKAILVSSSEPDLARLDNSSRAELKIDFYCDNFITAVRWILAKTISMKDVSFIIPTKNEGRNLPYILPYLPNDAEVILVDGQSKDNTIQVAQELYPSVKIFQQEGKGKGDALKLGFSQASRDFVITFDADGSFLPDEVYGLIRKLREGYDLVKGSRFLPGGGTLDMPLNRRLGNWGLTKLANLFYGSHYTDLVYGFHAFRRDALNKIMLHSDGFEMDSELYLRASRAGLKIAELPSFEHKRIYGVSNLNSIRDGSRILKTIIRERFRD